MQISSQFTLRAKTILRMVRQVKEVIWKAKLRTFAGREISLKQTKILVLCYGDDKRPFPQTTKGSFKSHKMLKVSEQYLYISLTTGQLI